MRARRSLRRLAAVLAASLTLAGLATAAPPAGASAPSGPTLTLSQDADSGVHGETHTVTATATAADGTPVPDGTIVTFQINQTTPWSLTVGAPVVDMAAQSGGAGGWLLAADGSVTPLGNAAPFGDARGQLGSAAVALAATPSGAGYWLASADGTVSPFGDAVRYGVAAGGTVPPAAPVVDLVPTPSGHGYWLLTSGGTTIPFGDAGLYKRTTGPKGNGTGVAMAVTPSGAGYWVLRADGVVVAYGDAVAAGDPSFNATAQVPMVGIAPSPTGRGYLVVSSHGQVFAFGDAVPQPSDPSMPAAVVGIAGSGSAGSYWLTGRDGSVHRYGYAPAIGWPGYPVAAVGGRATLPFTSSAPGASTVAAAVNDGTGSATAGGLTVRWRSGPPAAISFSPRDSVAYTGSPLWLTIGVTDAAGFGVDDGTPVSFTAAGTGTETPASAPLSTSGGHATVALTSTTTGQSTLTASAGGVTDTTSVTWTLADLRLYLGQPTGQVSLGSPAGYTAEVDSGGGSPAPFTVTLTLPPDAPATLDRGNWACDNGPGTFTCRATAAPGANVIQFHIRPTAAGPLTISGTVAADAGPDENPSDDTDTITTTVGPEPGPPALSQPSDSDTIGAGHVVTARSDAAPNTLVTFGVDGPAAPLPAGPYTAFAGDATGDGYWLASATGQVVARGTAPDLGSPGPLAAPVVDLRPTPTGNGYWLVTADGTVIARGDATDAGSMPAAAHLEHPIVGMAVTASGDGYWLADSAGGIYPFGDAGRPAPTNAAPAGAIVDIEGSPGGDGFWLLGADGGVQGFGVSTFGDMRNVRSAFGSMGAVGLTATPSGAGYWIGNPDGGLAAFGDARLLWTTNGRTALGAAPVTALDAASASGVWTMAADGSILASGNAPFLGPTAVVPLSYAGTAALTYTAAHTGTTTVTASVPGAAGPVSGAPLATGWTAAATGSISLSPPKSSLSAGTGRRVAALVLDPSGLPVADGTAVTFAASGTGDEVPPAATATTVGGRATFTFTSATAGQSTVKASAAGLKTTATVRWTAPTRPLPPSAPLYVDLSVGDGGVVVMWGAPTSAGTSPITRYTITASPGGPTVTAGPNDALAWVGDLVNGRDYVFTVTAWNDAGPGPGADIGPVAPDDPGGAVSGAGASGGSGGSDGGPGGSGGVDGGPGTGSGGEGSERRAGYWMLGAGGTVYPFGAAADLGGVTLAAGVTAVDLEPTPAGHGYWILDSHGVVHPFGDAHPFGDVDLHRLDPGEVPASLSATPSGAGYWIFSSKGRVLPFGDARSFGDMAKVALNGPVLDSIPTASGNGYYMVASDGGIFAFGDAHFAGSMGQTKLNAPVRSLVPDGDGSGYWLVASDGGIFAFDAGFHGSMGGTKLNKPITGMVRYGDGYLMAASDGGVFTFSDLPFAGSLGGSPPARPVVALAAA